MEGRATISTEVLARYAADAATEAPGVTGLAGRRGVRIADEEGRVTVELQLAAEWGAPLPELGRDVQQRVRAYLEQMADVRPERVDVVFSEVGQPS